MADPVVFRSTQPFHSHVYVCQAGTTEPYCGERLGHPQSYKASLSQPSRHAPLTPVHPPTDLQAFPLYKEFRNIILPQHPAAEEVPVAMKKSLSRLIGCWRVEVLVNPGVFGKMPHTPEHYYPINFTTDGCTVGNIFVRGRVYNMTVSEVHLDSVENGVVTGRALRYYSNFRPLRGVAVVDELIHQLVRDIRLVNVELNKDVIYLSDGQTTVRLARDPEGEEHCAATPHTSSTKFLTNLGFSFLNATGPFPTNSFNT